MVYWAPILHFCQPPTPFPPVLNLIGDCCRLRED